MKNITISDLFVYPIKSSKGINIQSSTILKTGFEFDRHFAIINAQNNIITARENANLLTITSEIDHQQLTLSHPDHETITINLTEIITSPIEVTIFKNDTVGKLLHNKANKWFSNILKEPCQLIKIDIQKLRKIKDDANENKIAFTDAFPIHIVTTASINDLNNKLETPINDNRFRPNIIISGTNAYEEENWKTVFIGDCEFDVITPTERCSLITINPFSLEKDKQQEPLRTLAKNKGDSKKVKFGIYLIPKNSGTIYKTDTVKVLF